MELTTPALLFPAISLLLLAYTNRFLVLGQLIRDLANRINEQNRQVLYPQIDNLRQRVRQIIWMQALGVSSFILCTITMILLYLKQAQAGHLLFGLFELKFHLLLLHFKRLRLMFHGFRLEQGLILFADNGDTSLLGLLLLLLPRRGVGRRLLHSLLLLLIHRAN